VTTTCRIPGNFMAEGRIFVHAAVASINPVVEHAIERDAVSFQVVDRSTGDGVRGEWGAEYPGVLRPMLEWTVRVQRVPEPQDHQLGSGV
jgi:lipopolysaccharide transport system ATP-binding protein